MALLELNTEEGEDGVRVALSGELDISSAPALEEALGRIESGEPPVLLVDLRALDFMDSTGLRTLVSANQRARAHGRRLAIVRGPEQVDRIFSVTRLDERFEIVDDPAALA
ncbi:MAG: STAS domain-containing protein [Actinomycetota bacterium]|nr:STAS domain-containing protein [Actinomycetota bacterium]